MMIKRRLGETAKNRRPPRCTKKSENIYNSTLLYLKFVLVWGGVLLLDFLLDVRFEYLWPVWLFVQSVHDTYKYQGLAFSLFFSCLSLTSDVICSYAIRDDWIFFLASSYVWVQYVWHTERGICFPTVALWFIFVYVEAAIRLKDLSKDMSHRVNLCRPFAAHSIGYPVVTLGFGFKSYISYKLRLRKQVEVQKENEFYFQLLKQALPKQNNLNFEDPVYEDENAGNVRANGHIPLGGLNGISNGIQWRLSNRDHQNNARTNEWLQNNPIPSSNGVLPNASNHSNNNNANSNSGGGSSASSFLSRPRVPLWTSRTPSNDNNSGGNKNQQQNSTDSTPTSSSNAGGGGKHISQSGGGGAHHSSGSSPNSSPHTHNSSGGAAGANNPPHTTDRANNSAGANSSGGAGGGGVLSPSTPKNPILAVKQIATAITGGSCLSPNSSYEELSKKSSSFCDSSKNEDSSQGHQQNGTVVNSSNSSGGGNSNSGHSGGGGNSRNNQSRRETGGGKKSANNYSSPRESKKRGGGGGGNNNNNSGGSDSRSLVATSNNNNWLEPNHNLISHTSATAIENLTDAEKIEKIEKLEMSVKALSADLSAKSLVNQELSSKLSGVTSSERQMKQELEQMRSDKRGLEERITDLSSQKVAANQKVEILEKRIEMERKGKLDAEKRIAEEKLLAKRKADDEISRFVAEIAKKNECTSTNCSKKLKELEGDKIQIQNELVRKNERMQNMEQEIETLRLLRDELSEKGREIARVQELNSRLENNLSIENKYKMELFSALNDCNRKINNFQVELASKNKEIMELQYRNTFAAGGTGDRFPFLVAHSAPPTHNGPGGPVTQQATLNHLGDNTVVAPGGPAPTQYFLPPQVQTHVTRSSPINVSNLNPEAMVYSPVNAAAVSCQGSIPGQGSVVVGPGPVSSNPNVVMGGSAAVSSMSGAIVSGVGGSVSSVSNVSPSDIAQ